MSQPIRKLLQNVTYHCYSRCIECRNLLSYNFVKEIAALTIKHALNKYDFELVHIEFVENHFHLVIKTTHSGQTISRIMQYIKARIAERYNRAVGRTGPFWNERFKSKIVEESDNPQNYFFYLLWYIAYNPVRKGVISNPRDSVYGSIRAYLEQGYIPKIPITIHEYFIGLGKTFAERVKYFLMYEEIYKDKLASLTIY